MMNGCQIVTEYDVIIVCTKELTSYQITYYVSVGSDNKTLFDAWTLYLLLVALSIPIFQQLSMN